MSVELLGVPASGKSTYTTKMIKEEKFVAPLDLCLYSDSRIKQNLNKFKLIIYAWLYRTLKCMRVFKVFYKITFKSFKLKVKMFMYLFSILGAIWKYETVNNKNLIFDEGINQVIWGLLYNSYESEDLIWELQYELRTEMCSQIVYLKVNREILYQRLIARHQNGGSELEHEVTNNPEFVDKSIHLIEEIIHHLQRLDITVLEK